MNVRVSAIRHNVRKRREEQIEELRTDSEDEEDSQPRWTTVDPSGVMLMSLSDEEDEETDEEEEKVDPSDVPNLSDSDNTEDSDTEGTNDSHDSGRSSPDQPGNYEDEDDRETEPDTDGEKGCNDKPKKGLPRWITPHIQELKTGPIQLKNLQSWIRR